MSKKSSRIELVLKKASKYFARAQRLYYIRKWAADSELLTKLKDFEEIIKEESLFDAVEKVSENYEKFLEETGVHKLHKNTQLISEIQHNLRNALNEITGNSYTNIEENPDAFLIEEDEFDGEEFMNLIEKISNHVFKRLETLDIPDFDPALTEKKQIIEMLSHIEKNDKDFQEVKRSGNIANTIAYIMQNHPKVAELIKEVREKVEMNAEDWQEILADVSQVVADPYNQQGGRIVDTGKQKEAKKVWMAKNPAKVAAQRARSYANFKKKLNENPELKEAYLAKKRKAQQKFYKELEIKNPKAFEEFVGERRNRLQEMKGVIPREIPASPEEVAKEKGTEVSRFFVDELGMKKDLISEWRTFGPAEKAKYQAQYDALVAQHKAKTTPGTETKAPTDQSYNIQTLRNKFVVSPARDERVRIVKDKLKHDQSEMWQKARIAIERGAKAEDFVDLAKVTPEYQQYISELPTKLKEDKSTRAFREFQRLPVDIQNQILESVSRLRTK